MGRGRGGGRGGGRGKFGRGRGGPQGGMARRDVAHIRQFGEKHPSQELRDFGGPPQKRGKFDKRGRGRGAPLPRFGGGREEKKVQTESDESSEEEEEVTPYKELLSVFSGRPGSGPVQINSDDEEEESEEDEKDDEDSDGSEEEDVEVKEELESGSDDEDDEKEAESDIKDEGNAVETETGEEEELKEDEDTVIDEAELDPELIDGAIKMDQEDPYFRHFEGEMSESMQKLVKEGKPTSQSVVWPILDRITYLGLQSSELDDTPVPNTLLDQDRLPTLKLPEPPLSSQENPTLTSLHIKSQLHETIPIANQVNIDKANCAQPLTPLQTKLFDMASRYHDIYYPKRTISNCEEIRLAYCLHAANHVLKTRTRILHHNAKMKDKTEVPECYRDQGFVRPKVLILAPFKDSALRIVKTLISLILKEEKGNVSNKKRFADEYGGETLFMPKTNPKPEDYTVTFSGNVEDNFKIGMAVTKKSIKLYTEFYSSDIIIASPLGLRVIIGAEGEKNRDYDFLSSLELIILDQADVFIMQNWDHVLHLMRHCHLQPVTTHGTDFARIRPWVLDGLSKHFCQTLIFSSIACPEHSSLLSKHCKNYSGQARILPTNLTGTISHITVQLPQLFLSFDVTSIQDVDDKRFDYFTKQVLPNFKGKLMSATLIFVSSYFDFVKIRNFFKREEESFVQICEYTKDKKIARARDYFFHGTNHFLLYTERAHFFRRLRLKGVGHIIFYQLPQNPQFYPELCNFIHESSQSRRVSNRKNSSVNAIYCKYDAPRLAAIVGTERATFMLKSEKKAHAFVSGQV